MVFGASDVTSTYIEEPGSEEGADALDDDVEDGLDETDLAPDEQPSRHRRVDVATWSRIQGFST